MCHRPLLIVLALFAFLESSPGHGHERPAAGAQADAAVLPVFSHLRFLLDTAVRDGLPGVSLRVKGPGIDFQSAAGTADLVIVLAANAGMGRADRVYEMLLSDIVRISLDAVAEWQDGMHRSGRRLRGKPD